MRQNSKRNTVQKNQTFDAVHSLANHPTASEVYEKVKQINSSASLCTVYRNLKSLAEEGVLRYIHVSTGADRFDHDTSEHYHAICDKCGRVTDVFIPYFSDIDDKVNCGIEFSDIKHDIIFTGTCRECIKKTNN